MTRENEVNKVEYHPNTFSKTCGVLGSIGVGTAFGIIFSTPLRESINPETISKILLVGTALTGIGWAEVKHIKTMSQLRAGFWASMNQKDGQIVSDEVKNVLNNLINKPKNKE